MSRGDYAEKVRGLVHRPTTAGASVLRTDREAIRCQPVPAEAREPLANGLNGGAGPMTNGLDGGAITATRVPPPIANESYGGETGGGKGSFPVSKRV